MMNKKPPDPYKCYKKQLKDVFNCENDIKIINDAIKRSHLIYIKVLMILKIYILKKYEETNNIPLITSDLIGLIQKSVSIPSSKGRKITDKNKLLIIDELHEIQNLIPNFTRVNSINLSSILKYQETEIITSIENNIKNNFLGKYIDKCVDAVFNRKDIVIKKELKKVKDDLKNNTLNCDIKYHKWLSKYRNVIVPFDYKESYYYDIKINPQKYIIHMLWINKLLDAYNIKRFQFIPQRTDFIIKHSYIDTKSLIELLIQGSKLKHLNNLSENQNDIWNTFTNIKKKYNKNYIFDYTIITDGFSCSIRYVEKSHFEKQEIKKSNMRKGRSELKGKSEEEKTEIRKRKEIIKKEKEESRKKEKKDNSDIEKDKYIEYPYLDEIDKDILLNLENINFCDPGNDRMITMLTQKEKIFKYTHKEHLKVSKRLLYQRKIEKIKDELNITFQENILSNYNSKSMKIDEYILYCSNKLGLLEEIGPLYENIKFRQYKWYNYIGRERAYSKMLNKLEKELGINATIIFGDASLGKNMRGKISTPNVTLKRKLKERFNVLMIDEFRTSCINCYTHKKETKNLKYKDKENKSRKLHSVLTYKMENNRLGCINRDVNAVKNMKYIYEHYLEYLREYEEEERPWIFSRSNKDM